VVSVHKKHKNANSFILGQNLETTQNQENRLKNLLHIHTTATKPEYITDIQSYNK
jgi:hypothetical protein